MKKQMFISNNLGSGEGTSVLQLVNTFESVNKVPIPYKIVPRRQETLQLVMQMQTKHIRN